MTLKAVSYLPVGRSFFQGDLRQARTDRVLEFTDHGLSIWEYPGDRRLFQLVVPELPTLGVDLTYP